MSANLYRTKNPDEFFHIHGSLEATTTLNMIGLEGQRPDLTDYEDIIKEIESHVQQYTAAELETMNSEKRQAGVTALKYEDFIKTPHVSPSPFQVNRLPLTLTRAKLMSKNHHGNSPSCKTTHPPRHSQPTVPEVRGC